VFDGLTKEGLEDESKTKLRGNVTKELVSEYLDYKAELYASIKSLMVCVDQIQMIEVIEEFLLKRVNSREDAGMLGDSMRSLSTCALMLR
jgi:hypothetical protein